MPNRLLYWTARQAVRHQYRRNCHCSQNIQISVGMHMAQSAAAWSETADRRSRWLTANDLNIQGPVQQYSRRLGWLALDISVHSRPLATRISLSCPPDAAPSNRAGHRRNRLNLPHYQQTLRKRPSRHAIPESKCEDRQDKSNPRAETPKTWPSNE